MKKEKRKYSMWQSIAYMIKTAWKHCGILLFLCAVSIAINVALELLQLFVAPEILRKVEQAVPISKLILTIVVFSGLLLLVQAGKTYMYALWIPAHQVKMEIMCRINKKACMTAFPNSCDPAALKLQQAAISHTYSGNAAIPNIWRTIISLLTGLTCFGIYMLMLSKLNIILVITVIITTLLSFFVTIRSNKYVHNHKDEFNTYYNQQRYIRRKIESIELAKDIRIFGLKPWITDIRDKAMALINGFIAHQSRMLFLGNLIDLLLTTARNGIAYIVLIRLTLERNLSTAEFLLYFSAIGNFAARVNGIFRLVIQLHRECQGVSEIMEYLDYSEPFRFEGGIPIPDAGSFELKMEHVTFRYPGTKDPIFSDLNLTIQPGEKLAIVGLNGAGKTTLVLLLCGFYDPDEGRVLLDGIDIREFNRREYYQLFSAVFQQFSILQTTIRDNVTQTVDEVDDDRVLNCLEKAGLRDFVTGLPAGLDTHVGRDVYLDGILLSGGQTQRLMLARALYKDGPILLLDEPTAALDPLAEHDIYQKYNDMTAGKTAVFISHRLASTRFCDRILFLSDGVIKEEGTHNQLLDLGGEYAQLFEIQSRYYREGRDTCEA